MHSPAWPNMPRAPVGPGEATTSSPKPERLTWPGTSRTWPDSIVATDRHRIDPFAYLRDVFARISSHPQNRLEELLPDKWLAAQARA